MAELTHYVEVRILPLDGADPSGGDLAHVLSLLVNAIHGCIVRGSEVALAFPRISSGKGVLAGEEVRLFGTVEALASVLVDQDFASLIVGGAIGIGKAPIRPVPSTITGWTRYTRERAAERTTPGWAARADARYLRRHGQGRPTADGPARPQGSPARPQRLPFHVGMVSSSTGQRFRLFVAAVEADGPGAGSFNSYGLSRDGSAVPRF